MASSARIDELRKKFDENPRRYFAPLANEYRKAGDLEQAIFICQEYLPQQPGHMSGHIVYGQALYEAGQVDEARAVFETALTLDPENLIALRHLGDIANQAGHSRAARRWYQRVLEADPRNEEIAALLSLLLTQPDDGSDEEEAPRLTKTLHLIVADPDSSPEATGEPVAEPATVPEPSHGNGPTNESTAIEPGTLPPVRGEAPPPLEEQASPDSSGVPPSAHLPPGEDGPGIEAASRHADAESPASAEAAAGPAPELFEPDALAVTRAPEELPGREGIAAEESTFVTETMAQLYLDQGHRAEAVAIYRKLVQRRPTDVALSDRLAELELPKVPQATGAESTTTTEAASPRSIRDFLRELLFSPYGATTSVAEPGEAAAAEPREGPEAESHEAPAAETRGGPAAETQGVPAAESRALANAEPGAWPTPAPREAPALEPVVATDRPAAEAVHGSIDVLFSNAPTDDASMAAAGTLGSAFRVDGSADGPPQGMPAHRAAALLSLDDVFRGGTARRSTPAAGVAASGFSFDRFFAGESAAGAVEPQSVEGGDASPSSDDDVAQFTRWLEGLKKT